MEYVTELECIDCGEIYAPEPERYLCESCDDEGLLEVKLDYERLAAEWSREKLTSDPRGNMWRYGPLIPVKSGTPRPRLEVGSTSLYHAPGLAKELGLENLTIKNEGLNPTGSLKDRASAVAVAKAQEAGRDAVACSSTGNAATSLAGNAASLDEDMEAVIFVPERVPGGKLAQLLIYGATVVSVQDNYEEAYNLSAESIDRWGWYNRNAAINPYLVEGKKTCVLEMAEQLDFEMPDWLVFSVGDGCTIAGAWKACKDLREIGFIDKTPRLLGVQAEGCAPITRSFRTGEPLEVTSEDTIADSIAVGRPRNYKKALRAVRNSGGTMVNVTDEEIMEMMTLLGSRTGIFGEPAGVAGLAGLRREAAEGEISRDDDIAFVVTGNGLKDIDNARRAASEPLEVSPDIEELRQIFEQRGILKEDE